MDLILRAGKALVMTKRGRNPVNQLCNESIVVSMWERSRYYGRGHGVSTVCTTEPPRAGASMVPPFLQSLVYRHTAKPASLTHGSRATHP